MQFLQSITELRTGRGTAAAVGLIGTLILISLFVWADPTAIVTGGEDGLETSGGVEETTGSTTPSSGAASDPADERDDASSRGAPDGGISAEGPAPEGRVHEVASVEQWNAAVAAASPGDTIQLTATITSPLTYRGSRAGGEDPSGTDGTADRPITITAAEGVWIDPGNLSNVLPALDIVDASHVHVIGVRVRNSQFGIRILHSNGTAEAPMLVVGNTVDTIGHAGIHVAGDLETHAPSEHVRVEGNTVARTGRIAPEFGEGIYLGYGTQEWADNTTNVTVVGNDIFQTTAEAVDVKPGTRNVVVEANLIHDLAPIRGGAISAHYVSTAPNPDPATPSNLVIRDNRIWNMNLDGVAGANDWAIWVGHGGVTIENNAIWGLRGNPSQTRAVRVRGLQPFGPHPILIVDNTFWTATGWLAEGTPWPGDLIQASGNLGPSGASGVEIVLDPLADAPPIGSGGDADVGDGPGSALRFEPSVAAVDWSGYEPGL